MGGVSADQELTPHDPSIVQVPGELIAVYHNGKITQWAFSPSGSNAGYFGPPAILWDGDKDLDITSTDGPFWRAVREAEFNVEWTE